VFAARAVAVILFESRYACLILTICHQTQAGMESISEVMKKAQQYREMYRMQKRTEQGTQEKKSCCINVERRKGQIRDVKEGNLEGNCTFTGDFFRTEN
jgi:hypothetical protein